MAPQSYLVFDRSLTNYSNITLLSTDPSGFVPSSASDTITNIVFGTCAVAIGIITIWQGRKTWNAWRAQHLLAASVTEGICSPFDARFPMLTLHEAHAIAGVDNGLHHAQAPNLVGSTVEGEASTTPIVGQNDTSWCTSVASSPTIKLTPASSTAIWPYEGEDRTSAPALPPPETCLILAKVILKDKGSCC